MIFFWQYGYEVILFVDLVEVIGVKVFILYVEFVNKEGLFCVVLDCYILCFVVKYEVVLFVEGKFVDCVLCDYFMVVVICFISKEMLVGCFIINIFFVLVVFLMDIVNIIKFCYVMQEQVLIQFLQQWQVQGELFVGCDVVQLV